MSDTSLARKRVSVVALSCLIGVEIVAGAGVVSALAAPVVDAPMAASVTDTGQVQAASYLIAGGTSLVVDTELDPEAVAEPTLLAEAIEAKPQLADQAVAPAVVEVAEVLRAETTPGHRDTGYFSAWERAAKPNIAVIEPAAAVVVADPCVRPVPVGGAAEAEQPAPGECSAIDDITSPRVIVNKLRPMSPESFVPDDLVDVPLLGPGGQLRAEAARAIGELAAAAEAEGAGWLGNASSFRSVSSQADIFQWHIDEYGLDAAEAQSARPGHSEHHTGWAIDLVACDTDGSCGSMEEFGQTPQGQWVAQNAHRFGFVVRYEADRSDVSGYMHEPWHLRYVGVDIAESYHALGYTTLEEYFGLPAAPGYP